MKMLGTDRWPVFSAKYSWISAPSSRVSSLGNGAGQKGMEKHASKTHSRI